MDVTPEVAEESRGIDPLEQQPQERRDEAPDPEPEGVERPADESDGATHEESTGAEPPAPLDDAELRRRLSALLFVSPDPVGEGRLAAALGVGPARVRAALEELRRTLDAAGLGFGVCGLAGGWTLMSAPELAEVVADLARGPASERVSAAALETLAIVAYRQPVTKAEIEAIRGVQAGPILRSLVDRGLVRVVGRSDVPGHPLEYGTTKEFLDRFGLKDLAGLPRDAELSGD